MGLAIFIGLGDLREDDPEGYEHHKQQLELINVLLTDAALPAHSESDGGEHWEAEMFGYSGLHYLRRVAAHVELRGSLPPPGDDQASEDPVLAEYYDVARGTARGAQALVREAKAAETRL